MAGGSPPTAVTARVEPSRPSRRLRPGGFQLPAESGLRLKVGQVQIRSTVQPSTRALHADALYARAAAAQQQAEQLVHGLQS